MSRPTPVTRPRHVRPETWYLMKSNKICMIFANYFPSSWCSSWLSTLNSSLSLFGERKRFLYFCLFGKSEAWSALYVSRERLHIWTVWAVWRVTTISQVVTLSLLGHLSLSLSSTMTRTRALLLLGLSSIVVSSDVCDLPFDKGPCKGKI